MIMINSLMKMGISLQMMMESNLCLGNFDTSSRTKFQMHFIENLIQELDLK